MKRLLITILALLILASAVFAQEPGAEAAPEEGAAAQPAEAAPAAEKKEKPKASLKIGGSFRTYSGYTQKDSKSADDKEKGGMRYESQIRLKFKATYSDWLVGYAYIRATALHAATDTADNKGNVHVKDNIWTRIGRKTGPFAFIGYKPNLFSYAGEMPYSDSGVYEEFHEDLLSIEAGYNFGMGEIGVGIYRPGEDVVDGTDVAASSKFASILVYAKVNLGFMKMKLGFFSNANGTKAYKPYTTDDESKMLLTFDLQGEISMLYFGLAFAYGLGENDQVLNSDGDKTKPMAISVDIGIKTVVKIGVQFNYFVNMNRQMRFNLLVGKKFGKLGLDLEFYYATANEDFFAAEFATKTLDKDSTQMGIILRTKFSF